MNRELRWPVTILAGLSLVLLNVLAPASAVCATEGHFERTLKVSGPVDLNVGTGSGSITVRTGDTATVQVTGTIKASGSFWGGEDAEKKVKYLESNPPIEQHGNIIKIGHIEDEELRRNITISYEIVTPPETRLRSGTGSGSESIEGIRGPLDASTGSGQIKASHIGSEVHASTGSGEIELNDVKGNVHASTGSGPIRAIGIAGGLRASTGSGSVTLEETAPGDVEVGTGSGRIELKHVHGAVRAHTASGNITADGEGSDSWRLQTASGSVTVHPTQSGFELRARTVSGHITTERPMTVQGMISHRELSGKVGNGGFLLDVSTVSGNIHVE